MKVNGYELLGNAIVLQAAKDYRIALRTQHLNPNDKKKNNIEITKLEKFFSGEYFKTLTSLDGPELADKIKRDLIANDYHIRRNRYTKYDLIDEDDT